MMKNSNKSLYSQEQQPTFKKTALALALAAALPMSASYAQDDAAVPEGMVEEELIVTGTIRDTIRNSIELKREATTIVDAISSSEIGATPDLSVAETLERITGVTADRFKGNASEISIRGLGPFLGASTYNGREVSSGSGNRSVAFSQFPSELVSKAVVYKGQQADIQEGGVAGLIDLGSIRPIDFGKTRFRAEIRGVYNDYADKVEGDNGVGSRLSVSYTDVFDTSSGTWGVSVGYAGSDTQTPEESYNTSSFFRACNQDVAAGSGSGNCEGQRDIPDGQDITDTNYYYTTNERYFRAMDTEETRDAVLATVQWQPNDDWDVTWDGQFSNRFYYEDRQDLSFEAGRADISNPRIFESRALRSFTGRSRIANRGEFRERDEDYTGSGLNVRWDVSEALTLEGDLSYSDTHRDQFYTQVRLRSDNLYYDWQANVDDFAEVTEVRTALVGGDVISEDQLNDLTFYDNGSGRRVRLEQFEIDDTIRAFRFEGEYVVDGGFISSVEAGVRFSNHEHANYYRDRKEANGRDDGLTTAIAEQCGRGFIVSNYGEDANFDDNAFDTWANYDTRCAARLIVDQAIIEERIDGDPANYEEFVASTSSLVPNSNDILVEEDVQSAFVMANFESQFGSVPVSGNIGVRVVRNTTTSTGYSQRFVLVETIDPDDGTATYVASASPDDIPVASEAEYTYTNVLPSFNINLGVADDVDLRFSLYRAVSRPDMWWLGAGRAITADDDGSGETNVSPEAAAAALRLSGTGNNRAEAIESDNFDVSIGWYPSEDFSLSLALYYKKFNAAFDELTGVNELIDVDIVQGDAGSQTVTGSVQVNAPVSGIVDIVDETSSLEGFEITAQYGFTSLPEPWNGFGVAGGYNRASTDFETQERYSGIVADGNTPEVLDVLEPGSLPGFSEETYNAQLYWENYGWSIRLAYKYRSEYLKPFGGTLDQTNRFVRPTDDLSFSASYDITDNLQAKFQVLNIQNSIYVEERVTDQAINRAEYNGIKYFLGLSLKI